MGKLTRYSRIMAWAMNRWTKDGMLVITIGNKATAYTRVEGLAWDRYILGMPKAKVNA